MLWTFRKVTRNSRLPILLLSAVQFLGAEEFSARMVDGLNRPLADVLVELSCYTVPPNQRPLRSFTLLQLRSDKDGMAHGVYESVSSECEKNKSVAYRKEGYGSFDAGYGSRYVLRRQFDAEEVHRVVKLDHEARLLALRELLAGEFSTKRGRFWDLVFYYEDRLRPALRELAHDPDVTVDVRDLLSLIGVSEDLRLIMQLAPPSEALPDRWRYGVVTALLNPDSEDEWTFLRRCALNEFNDRWVDAGAIQSLTLIASPRSLEILREAQARNSVQAAYIAWALKYFESNPVALADRDLVALAKRVAQIIKIGTWRGNGKPRYNESGDKALVDFNSHSGLDGLTYTATFHKTDGVWRLRGARETRQQFEP